MSDTPRTDEVLRIENNWGAYPGSDGQDGVLPQEAHDDMVAALTHLARKMERELAARTGTSQFPSWVPVSERLPDVSGGFPCIVAVDVKDGSEETMLSIADFHNGRFDVYDDKLEGPVTHWMPFPVDSPPAGAPGVEPHTSGTRLAVIERAGPILEKLARERGQSVAEYQATSSVDQALAADVESNEALTKVAPMPTEADLLGAQVRVLREALDFYAKREHYLFDGEPDDWEAPSGEPQNWLCAPSIPPSDKETDLSWMIEDGGVARDALTRANCAPVEGLKPCRYCGRPESQHAVLSKRCFHEYPNGELSDDCCYTPANVPPVVSSKEGDR